MNFFDDSVEPSSFRAVVREMMTYSDIEASFRLHGAYMPPALETWLTEGDDGDTSEPDA